MINFFNHNFNFFTVHGEITRENMIKNFILTQARPKKLVRNNILFIFIL